MSLQGRCVGALAGHNVFGMNKLNLPWGLILALGITALLRPAVRIVEHQLDADWSPAAPILLTLIITALWVLALGRGRDAKTPATTLVAGVFVGLTYAVLAMLISAVVSPILDSQLNGPLANPIAIVPMLAVNAGWGLLAGALALLVRPRMRQ